jgi:hypothetical protein
MQWNACDANCYAEHVLKCHAGHVLTVCAELRAEAEARIKKQAKAIDFLQRANKRLRVYRQFTVECYGYEFENWNRGRS